ncbi:MAG: RadC family protein [Clostridia bacterium]|nr:RadC family protein [Clostridia bacterium]
MGNINKGHRQRMKQRVRRYGLDSLQDHEALELLLFYALPYKNTNGTAHELINKFGSFSGVFCASEEELMSVSGIGDHAALLIRLMPRFFSRYSQDVMNLKGVAESRQDLEEYIINHFIACTTEHVQLFLFDAAGRRINSITVHEGGLNSVAVNSETIAEYVFTNRATTFILAHNHPSGDIRPSPDDLYVTRDIYRKLSALNREMEEHYIVAGGKCVPILDAAKEMFDK